MVSFFPFTAFHGKGQTGSTEIRVNNLIKYWDEADLYKYGTKPDVLIFQKIYWLPDYDFPTTYSGGLKILDICDPDWLDNSYVKRTVDGMDAIVVPTKSMQEFMQQLTDKPVKVIKDRFDIELVPKPKTHTGKAKNLVWFGYAHNAECLEFAVPALEKLGLSLTCISNDDPMAWRWANDSEAFRKTYKFKKYNEESIYENMAKHDICLLPQGTRPVDRFKSENKTIKAYLGGLPVAKTIEDLEQYADADERNKTAKENYDMAIKEYDVKLSVKEYQELIEGLKC